MVLRSDPDDLQNPSDLAQAAYVRLPIEFAYRSTDMLRLGKAQYGRSEF